MSKPPGYISTVRMVCFKMRSLLEQTPATPSSLKLQLDAVIKLLPRLQYGLDVNVRFNSVRGFEFTAEMAAFDMSGITLLHGWIFDPEDRRTVSPSAQPGLENSPCRVGQCLVSLPASLYRLRLTHGHSSSFVFACAR